MSQVMTMNGYEKRTHVKKAAILEVARELFAERGVTDVGVSEIAAKARVSQVSIYNYFGDKQHLVREVLLSYLDSSMQEYEEILKQAIPFGEKLKRILNEKRDLIVEISRAKFSQAAWEDKSFQKLFREAALAKAVGIYTQFIEEGKKEGAIDERMPNDAILAYLLSTVSIIQRPEYLNTSPEYKMAIVHLFLHGVLKE
jgi:AcrR family transcriptional regulator